MIFVIGLWTFLRALFLEPAAVALDNLALRHQLGVLERSVRRPRLARWDRILWVWLSRIWPSWRALRGTRRDARALQHRLVCDGNGTRPYRVERLAPAVRADRRARMVAGRLLRRDREGASCRLSSRR
jgi:hypothetical protein